MPEAIVRSYKMKTDCGFAPNPDGGVLTIATCKAGIREAASCGEWIAGFTSLTLNGDPIGEERLVFLMRVTEKLRRDAYYERFPQKRPDRCPCGDNIYQPKGDGTYRHVGGVHHREKEAQEADHQSAGVLLSDEFYYFGGSPVPVDKRIRPNVPQGQSRYGALTTGDNARAFIAFVKDWAAQRYPGKSGMFAEPHRPCDAVCPRGCEGRP